MTNNKIGRGHKYGGVACFRRSATTSFPMGLGPSGPQFYGFSSTYAYTVRPRTAKFGVVTDMLGRDDFRRSAMPLHLHNCVARFLSDN